MYLLYCCEEIFSTLACVYIFTKWGKVGRGGKNLSYFELAIDHMSFCEQIWMSNSSVKHLRNMRLCSQFSLVWSSLMLIKFWPWQSLSFQTCCDFLQQCKGSLAHFYFLLSIHMCMDEQNKYVTHLYIKVCVCLNSTYTFPYTCMPSIWNQVNGLCPFRLRYALCFMP